MIETQDLTFKAALEEIGIRETPQLTSIDRNDDHLNNTPLLPVVIAGVIIVGMAMLIAVAILTNSGMLIPLVKVSMIILMLTALRLADVLAQRDTIKNHDSIIYN